MSLGSKIIKGGIAAVLIAGIGVSIDHYQDVKADHQDNQVEIKAVKKQYQQEQKRKPEKKVVSTQYQQALDTTNKYLDLENKLHDTKSNSTKEADKLYDQLHDLTHEGTMLRGPQVPRQIKGWTGKVSYGGQNNNGQISMAIRFTNKDGKLMKLVTLYYNTDSKRLSGMTYYYTHTGMDQFQKTLGG